MLQAIIILELEIIKKVIQMDIGADVFKLFI